MKFEYSKNVCKVIFFVMFNTKKTLFFKLFLNLFKKMTTFVGLKIVIFI